MARERFDDEGFDDRQDDPPRRRRREVDPAEARGKVTGPAIGLIVVGLIALAMFGFGLINAGAGGGQAAQLKQQREMQLKQIEDNAALQPAQKQQQKEMVNNIYDAVDKFAPYFPVLTGMLLIGTLIILIGGVQLLRGKGRGLGMASAILAMIPCFSSCGCILGIPIGIWALVVLSSADVKAAFAAGPPDSLANDLDDRG